MEGYERSMISIEYINPIVDNLTFLNLYRVSPEIRRDLKIVKLTPDVVKAIKSNVVKYLGHIGRVDEFFRSILIKLTPSDMERIHRRIEEVLNSVIAYSNKPPEKITENAFVYNYSTSNPIAKSLLNEYFTRQNKAIEDDRKVVLLLKDVGIKIPNKVVDLAHKSLKLDDDRLKIKYALLRKPIDYLPSKFIVSI